jgi:hypothetical protein
MIRIDIESLYDEYDCENCGSSYAEGAIVKFDGEVVLELTPSAHCFGGTNYYTEDVYLKIIEKLGGEII